MMLIVFDFDLFGHWSVPTATTHSRLAAATR